MRLLNVILVAIVIFLAAISLRLMHISILLENLKEAVQLNTNSNLAASDSSQRLKDEMASLRKQVDELTQKGVKR